MILPFCSQFDSFDPLIEPIPDECPIPNLEDIAERARKLLGDCTREKAQRVAQFLDWLIDDYFEYLKEREIERLKLAGDMRFLRPEKDDTGIVPMQFNTEMVSELDLPEPNQISPAKMSTAV